MTTPEVEGWDARVQHVWDTAAGCSPAVVLRADEHLAAERSPQDPAALFERASAHDHAGDVGVAEPLYRRALAAGLTGDRRARATIHLAGTLRLLGRASEAVDLLEHETEPDPPGRSRGRPRRRPRPRPRRRRSGAPRPGPALTALADHLPRYERAVRHHAERPHVEAEEEVAVASATTPTAGSTPPRHRVLVGQAAPELDRRLSAELDAHNAAATPGVEPARELTVQVLGHDGELLAGLSGWTRGVAAGIALTWVHLDARGDGHGASLLREFEEATRSRGCTHVFATSCTFQAPDFYRRAGYRDLFRWNGLPTPGAADVHLRKELT